MFKHILLATDSSASSEHAAQRALNLVRTHGAKLTVLYVARLVLGSVAATVVAQSPVPVLVAR